MTTTDAVKFMSDTGRAVVVSPRGTPYDKGFYRLYRNDVVLMLLPDTACSATVWNRFTTEEFVALGKYYEFEEYNGSN